MDFRNGPKRLENLRFLPERSPRSRPTYRSTHVHAEASYSRNELTVRAWKDHRGAQRKKRWNTNIDLDLPVIITRYRNITKGKGVHTCRLISTIIRHQITSSSFQPLCSIFRSRPAPRQSCWDCSHRRHTSSCRDKISSHRRSS